ncbi:glucohydrolase, partial [Bacillus sp. 7586-K]
MQWSSEVNAGFTTGTPWIGINENYKEINVAAQQENNRSVLQFYKNMIRLKKANEVFTYGTYNLILDDHPQIYAYTRTTEDNQVVVFANLSETMATWEEHLAFHVHSNDLLLAN